MNAIIFPLLFFFLLSFCGSLMLAVTMGSGDYLIHT